jgi:ABC-type transport system involved in multi-copper enzyme maturation permease subunit
MRTYGYLLKPQFWLYQIRLVWSWSNLIPIGILGIILINELTSFSPSRVRAISDLIWIFEIYLPLVGLFFITNIIPSECDDKTLELHLTYPQSSLEFLFTRVMAIVIFLTIILFITLLAVYQWYATFELWEVLSRALPTIVYLTSIGLFFSSITGSYIGAIIPPVLYWAWELATQGRITRSFSLFAWTYPQLGTDLIVNKVILALLASFLISLSAWVFSRKRLV